MVKPKIDTEYDEDVLSHLLNYFIIDVENIQQIRNIITENRFAPNMQYSSFILYKYSRQVGVSSFLIYQS